MSDAPGGDVPGDGDRPADRTGEVGADPLLVADAHVHLHDRFDLAATLEAARDNLLRVAAAAGSAGARRAADHRNQTFDAERSGPDRAGIVPVLYLCETAGTDAFARLREGHGELRSVAGDGERLRIRLDDGPELLVVAGRQLVTAEGLEVLSLASPSPIEEGGPVADTVAAVAETGGVPVLSWSPGKWLGRRGRVAAALLDSLSPERLLLGDTAIRPTLCREPGLIRRARRRGFGIVAGTDPLPIGGESRRIGRYGFVLDGPIVARGPAEALREILRGGATPRTAGRRDGPLTAARRWLAHRFAGSVGP